MNNTPDKTDAKTDKSGNDEQQEQRLTADAGDKGSYPGYRLSDQRGNVSKYCSHRTPPLLKTNNTADKTDAEPDKAGYHEQKQQRIRRDSTDERAYPSDCGSDKSCHIPNYCGDSNSGSSMYAAPPILY